ncbi:sulfatase-like hydrolase/transferase [Planctomycetaceae bacterium SH139]
MFRFFSLTMLAIGLAIGSWSPSTAAEPAAERPNFILMIADDMATEDCGPMGHPHIRTPNLDRLAAAGMTFEQAFLTCSSCSPSRSSMISCRYPHQTDAEQLHQPLPAEQITYVELLKKAGYHTAASGKWHLGPAAKRGFDAIDEVSSAGFQLPSGTAVGNAVMSDANNASGCAGWVKTLQNCPADKPFFLWLAAVDPHRDYADGIIAEPHTAADAVVPPYLPDTAEVRKDLALYYDEITRLDSYVGAVLDQLQATGRADNTYVIFISDNGRPFPRCKTTVLDSGIRTPLFIQHPQQIPAGSRTQALVSTIDIGATILELANVQPVEAMQGQSFRQVLSDPAAKHRQQIFAEQNWHDYDAHQRAVRTTQFKYIRNFAPELTRSPPADAVRSPTFLEMRRLRDAGKLDTYQMQCFISPQPAEELYDVVADPHELVNLANDPAHQQTLTTLRKTLDDWRAETFDAAYTFRSPDEFDRETGDPLANRKRPRTGKYDGFVAMFNGQDLSGWKLINSHPSTWSVAGELLICSGKPIGELRTERMYQNFVLDLEWRHMVPGGNAGIFVWADDITAPGVPFHRGIEVQVLENAYGNTKSYTTHGDIFPIHGATMKPINGRGGQRAFPLENRSHPSPEWNHYRIVCNNGEISLAVNGKFVTQGRAASPSKGYICIESEGGVAHYRNVRIKELPDTPVDPSAVAIADRGYRCLYQGIDLADWKTMEPNAWRANDWVLDYRGGNTDSGEPAKPAPLTTLAQFSDLKFVVDVRPSDESGTILIAVAGVELRSDRPELAEALSKPGQWSRLEGRIADGKLDLTVNGTAVISGQALSPGRTAGPFSLAAEGPTSFTNIYVSE